MKATDWIAVFQAVVTTAGVIIAYVGLRNVYRQLKGLRMSVRREVESRLYSQNAHARELLVQYPDLRKYIFGGVPIAAEHEDYERVRSIAEIYLNYLEHLMVEQESLEIDNLETWKSTATDVLSRSPIMQKNLCEHPAWYAKALQEVRPNVPPLGNAGEMIVSKTPAAAGASDGGRNEP